MVSKSEILEYGWSHEGFTLGELFEDLKRYPFKEIHQGNLDYALKKMIKYGKIRREKTGHSEFKRGPVWKYFLTDYAKEERQKYGSFFNTPQAKMTKERRYRVWAVGEGKYFVNINEGDPHYGPFV